VLQLKTIHKDTFELLQELSDEKGLEPFALAGGTALALQLGHRISIDLDFITGQVFDSFALFEKLGESFDIENSSTATNALSLFIKWQGTSVKTDCIRHNYPRLKPWVITSGIRLFSLEDIAVMKLNAVANRGAKKDFYDIHALLSHFSLRELLDFFAEKYQTMNRFTVTKSLAYFDDADLEPDPMSLTATTWDQIKADMKQILRETA
jgi:predicted nucleotidyltransferase component of viral defense system